MRIDDLIVEVRDVNRARVGRLLPQDLVGFSAVLRFNNVGTWELPEIPDVHPLAEVLRSPGSGIIVTGPEGVILSGPVVAATHSVESGKGPGTWHVQGVDDSVILGERLAYPTPTTADVTAQTSAYDTRTGAASSVMRGYVRANLFPSVAPAVRAVSGLVLAADPVIGSTVTKSARFDILGELLSDVAAVDGLGFDIRQNGDFLEFSVFEPVDRSLEIRMDVANNTLSRTEYAYGRPNATLAIVAGQGEGAARQFVEVVTAASGAAQTLWDRRIESFVDQRNTSDVAELTQAGLEKLATDGQTITSVDVVPSSDVTMVYGRDFNLGDRVGVNVGGQEVAAILTTVSLSIQSDGVRVGATVGDPTGVDFEALTAKKSTDTQRRVNSLERKEGGAGGGGITEPVDSLQWNTAFTGGSTAPGMLAWNDLDGTLEFQLKGGNVTLQIGQEQVLRVKNSTGATLTEGTVVYISSSDGTNFNVSKALASADATSAQTLGVLTENLANGGHGYVTTYGLIRGLNTSALTEGQIIYLSGTTAGTWTATKPSAPTHLVYVGYCLRAHATTGVIFVRTQNGYELDELHDVSITSPATGDLIVRNAGNTLWQNKTLAGAGIAAAVHTHAAADVTSGVFDIARIPAAAQTPTGVISQFAGTTAPNGYLLCQGQAVSRTTYAALFAVIGGTYGVGDGSTTFNLPDLRGRVAVGVDSAGTRIPSNSLLGQSSGAATHTLTAGQTPLVYGGWTWHGAEGGGPGWNLFGNAFSNTSINWSYYRAPGPSYGGAHSITNVYFHNGGNNEAHNNLQPYLILNSIIKT